MWKLRYSAFLWPRRRFTSNPTFLVAFCSTTSREHSEGDADLKIAIKSRIFRALECKEKDMAREQLHDFFSLNNVTLLDCNQMLKACGLLYNAQVADAIWNFMLKKQITVNTFSVACLLHTFCRCQHLDKALNLLYKLGEEIDVQPHIDFCSIFLNGCLRAGSASYAEKCLRYIKTKGLKENELVYLELLKLAGRRKDLPAVDKAWSLILNSCKPALPCVQSYCAAITALCATSLTAEALLTFRGMVQLIARNEGFFLSDSKMGILSLSSRKDTALSADEVKESMEGRELFESTLGKEALTSGNKIDSKEQLHASKHGPCDLEETTSTKGDAPSHANTKMEGDSPLVTKGEDAASTDEDLFSQIFYWTRLAMSNLQQPESKELPESVEWLESLIPWPYEGKFARAKYILRHAFNAIMKKFVYDRKFHSAEVMFNQMSAVGLKPDVHSFNAILQAVVNKKGLQEGFQLVKSMELNGLQPNTKTYNSILNGFCQKLDVDKAEALLERMLKTGGDQGPSAISFNIVLEACGILDDPLRALRVFSKMVEADIKPDIVTILYLVRAFGRVNFPLEPGTQESHEELTRRLQAIESYMEQSSLSHTFRSFNTMLAAYSTEGMVDTIIQRLDLAEGCIGSDGLPILDTVSFNTAITACNRAKQWDAAKHVFRRMRVLGLEPDRETYNTFMNGCAERRKVDDAFLYMDKLQEKNLKPDAVTYSTLLKACCLAGELDDAINILKDMEEAELLSSHVPFITIVHTAANKERMDLVEFCLEHMHRKKIQPSIAICELVVSAYLRRQQIDDAVEALRVLSMRMLPEGMQPAGESEDVLKQVFFEDSSKVEESTRELLKDAIVKQGPVAEALLAARLSGFGNAMMEQWNAEQSWWAKRLRAQYVGL